MTFTEAAIEVLRAAGRPLHYKKITQIAVEKNLLSHVGKTPDVTMSARLALAIKKDRGESPIVKLQAGVFALKDFSAEVMSLAESEYEHPVTPEQPAQPAAVTETAADGDEEVLVVAKPVKLAARAIPGAEVYPEEDDDDQPIFNELKAPAREAKSTEDDTGARRRRRRRRRGGRNGDSDASFNEQVDEFAAEDGEGAEASDQPREPREARESREAREPREPRESREFRGRRELPERPLSGDPDVVGKELADAIATVLSTSGDRQATSIVRVAEQLVRRGRLSGDPAALVPTLSAVIRADNARRDASSERPRFRVSGTRLTLCDWLIPKDAITTENDVQRMAIRQRTAIHRALVKRLSELPAAGFAELIASWLNVQGVSGLRAVRPPSAKPGEMHLAGTSRRGIGELRLGIVVFRDGREISRDNVVEARGALHHYGQASALWLVTLGGVSAQAAEEATAQGAPPCAVLDAMGLARSMEKSGIGIKTYQVPLLTLDLDLFEGLRGGASEGTQDRPERQDRQDRSDRRPNNDRNDRQDRHSGRRDRHDRFERRGERQAQAPRAEADAQGDVKRETEQQDTQALTESPVQTTESHNASDSEHGIPTLYGEHVSSVSFTETVDARSAPEDTMVAEG